MFYTPFPFLRILFLPPILLLPLTFISPFHISSTPSLLPWTLTASLDLSNTPGPLPPTDPLRLFQLSGRGSWSVVQRTFDGRSATSSPPPGGSANFSVAGQQFTVLTWGLRLVLTQLVLCRFSLPPFTGLLRPSALAHRFDKTL